MKTFVISMPTSVERRKHVTDSLSSKGIAFEFIDAVNGRENKHPLLHRYDRAHYIINRGREAKAGELGCYASHYLAWEKACELNEPIVVLEDDLTVQDDFVQIINDCEQWISKKGFIRIEPWKTKLFTKSKPAKIPICIIYSKFPNALRVILFPPSVRKLLLAAVSSLKCLLIYFYVTPTYTDSLSMVSCLQQ